MSTLFSTSFEDRKTQTDRYKQHYPNSLPIVLIKDIRSTLPEFLHNQIYLAPKSLLANELITIIRKKVSLPASTGITIFAGKNQLVTSETPLFQLYENFAEEDGFLYLLCTDQEVFGNK